MPGIIGKLRKITRGRRLDTFRAFVSGIRAGMDDASHTLRVVDIGGTVALWEQWWNITAQENLHITLINNHHLDATCRHLQSSRPFIENINCDANTLTLEDLRPYDIIFSNSFFEHLRSREEQMALAHTIVASGKSYFIQVPNKFSPVDPHHPFAPFFALYPLPLRVRLLTLSAFGPSYRAKSIDAARRWQAFYNPLGGRDMRQMFPDAQLRLEQPLGIPMSILAVRQAAASDIFWPDRQAA